MAETRAEVRRRTCANFERRRRDTSGLDVQLSHASRMRGGRGNVWATTAIMAAANVCARYVQNPAAPLNAALCRARAARAGCREQPKFCCGAATDGGEPFDVQCCSNR